MTSEIVVQTESILGYSVSRISSLNCIYLIEQWLASDCKGKLFICANPHSLVQAADDLNFQKVLHGADLLTPDGSGIILASKILGGDIRERVTGSDIFWGLTKSLNVSCGRSYFFLGTTDETLEKIKTKMAEEYPNIRFAGSYSPPYKPEFSKEESILMVDAVNAAAPDVLWVGMTAPKQEKWIYQNRDKLNVKFIGAIGAVFDFYVGNVKRSHPFFRRMGLEWLPRLLQEPRRLFRRNFVSSPLFLLMVLKQRIGRL